MPSKMYRGVAVDVDNEGYLLSPLAWTEQMGEAMAAELGVEMTPDHWKVVRFARQDQAETGQTPGLRRIASQSGVDMKRLYALFPKGPGKLIAKIAGVPKPKACL